MGESRVPLATARILSEEYSAVMSAFARAKVNNDILSQR